VIDFIALIAVLASFSSRRREIVIASRATEMLGIKPKIALHYRLMTVPDISDFISEMLLS